MFVPRKGQYDLVDGSAVRPAFEARPPDIVIHLAAVVGGIGSNNRAHPGSFFYDNLMMGAQLVEEARRTAHKSSSPWGRSAPIPSSHRSRSVKMTCGTATRKKRTRPTGWRRR